MDARLEAINGNPVLRFERRLAHPVAKVWRAVTDPAEMANWFPAAIQTELAVGARMRFTFPEQAPVDGTGEGEVLEYDPPRVYAFRWNNDVLRFELVPEGEGCVLHFSQVLGGGPLGRLGAGRNAAGWDHCLDALLAQLDGGSVGTFEWLPKMERYIEVFGLGAGEVVPTDSGCELRFARDLVWKSTKELWNFITEEQSVQPGDGAPLRATNGYVTAGEVVTAEAPTLLEYRWLHEGEPVGLVRWRFAFDAQLGSRVELTQTVPARLADQAPTALAAWHTQLELFFAGVHGDIRCPWPTGRTEQLADHYAGLFREVCSGRADRP
ncbi:SRPBCC family protein [Kutzneria viridogrisea]|uniref:Uncharacterized protein YndB with AHSA1/START domain n=1 Tax=Kutzneria viridogrisea TaxID=47990 RepID=A0ABR6BCQ0_9PSEU|nr:uncharacterized protein YndB with AHSA1/START domain [Kutzneria viridogrisea]